MKWSAICAPLLLVHSLAYAELIPKEKEMSTKCKKYSKLPEKRFTEIARQQVTVEGHIFTVVLDRRIKWVHYDDGEDQILRLTVTSERKKSRRYFVSDQVTLCTERWQPYLSVEKYLGKDFLILRTATAWDDRGEYPMPSLDADVEIRVLEIMPTGEVKRRLYAETNMPCYKPLPCPVYLEKLTEDGGLLGFVTQGSNLIDDIKTVVRYRWTKNCWAHFPEDDDKESVVQTWDDVCVPNQGLKAGTDKLFVNPMRSEQNPKKCL